MIVHAIVLVKPAMVLQILIVFYARTHLLSIIDIQLIINAILVVHLEAGLIVLLRTVIVLAIVLVKPVMVLLILIVFYARTLLLSIIDIH